MGVVRRLLDVQAVPARVVVTVALASYGGLVLAAIAQWPLWGMVLAALLPWGLVFLRETVWLHRHHGALALFYLLVVTQGGHLLEHLIQYLQVNVFDVPGSGVFSALDTEWVHFTWNTWVLLATIPLLLRFRGNRWLWLAAVAAVWHEAEHLYLIVQYISSGQEGNPGLLASGGVLGGGLPVSRVNLHFYYNVVETFPLFVAFGVALRGMRNEWIAETFPDAPEEVLVDVSSRVAVRQLAAGDVLVEQDATADAFYVVSRGRLEAVVTSPDGETRVVGTLGRGDPVGETGLLTGAPRSATVRAATPAEVVRVGRADFAAIVGAAPASGEQLTALADERRRPTTPAGSASAE